MAQRIALSKSTTIDPPKKMRKAEKKEISTLINSKYSSAPSLKRQIEFSSDKLYMVDDIVVVVNSSEITRQTGKLKSMKTAWESISKGLLNTSSKIESIAGKDVFVIDMISEGFKLYRFTVVNKNEDFLVIGFVQFKPGDELKGRKVLEDIIKLHSI